jgi:hypothetical protein
MKGADGKVYMEIEAVELAMLLEGVDAPVVHRRKRYRRTTEPKMTPAT